MALPPQDPDELAQPQGQPADPSMEDILASIRRILSEDDAGAAAAADPDPVMPPAAEPVVLTLQESMIVAEPSPPPAAEPPTAQPPTAQPPRPAAPARPEAAAEPAAGSIGAMLRALIAEREQVAVHRGGPTIEDLAREEIRPLLKQWLDANLAPIVERLVRAEIERVVGRAIS